MSRKPSLHARTIAEVPFPIQKSSIVLEEGEIHIPASAHTLDGFRAWAKSEAFPGRGRIAFLDKEIFIDMSPEEITTHNRVKTAVCFAIYQLTEKADRGIFLGDRTLVTNEEAGLATEPDGAFVFWETLEAGRARLIPQENDPERFLELEGTPDWVLEIVSKSSVKKDTKKLRKLYHQAGILEYWLIDARREIAFQILRYQPGDYQAVALVGGWLRSPLFGKSFRLERRRGRLGLWDFDLRMKNR